MIYLLLCMLVALYMFRLTYKKPRLPKGYRTPCGSSVTKVRVDSARDGFSAKKVPPNLDAIVVGSGMGGLYAAATMARAGRRVLVLEQHYIAGGCTHSFDERGYEFDTGLHYVGNIPKYSFLLNLVTDTEHHVAWQKMGTENNGYVYDQIVLGHSDPLIHNFRGLGREAYVEDLIKRFPHESKGIREFARTCDVIAKKSDLPFILKMLPGWVGKLLASVLCSEYRKWARLTSSQAVGKFVQDPKCQALLLAQFGDVGGPPDEASFFIQSQTSRHYWKGGWYPVGGPQVISRALISTIEKAGGRVLVRAPVSRIMVQDGAAIGVRLEKKGNITISAPLVISAVGYPNTFQRLLDPAVSQLYAPKSLSSLTTSTSHMYAFVGFNKSTEELKLPSHNVWVLPCKEDYDLNGMVRRLYQDPNEAPMMLFIGFPSAKDPDFENRFPGKSTCVIITEARFEWFVEWENKRQGSRGQAYESKKEAIGKRMVDGLCHFFPHVKDHIDLVEYASPITNNFYLNSTRGESYGLAGTPARYLSQDLRTDVGIKGLIMAGQDVVTSGIAGAMAGGLFAAHVALGYPTLWDTITGRDLVSDLRTLQRRNQATKELTAESNKK